VKWLRRGSIALVVASILLFIAYRFLIAQGAAFSVSL
jgi:hypothetical protein